MTASGELLIFDGDDTLWETEPLYDRARAEACLVVAGAGLDAVAWDRAQREIDVQNVRRFGLSAKRFPTSCVEAYERVAGDAGEESNAADSQRVWDAASRVFDAPAPLMPGAEELVSALSEANTLALLTKGDREVQLRRVEESGLARYFNLVNIVDEKTSETFRMLVSDVGIPTERSWSIGNSLPSDIEPALRAGLRAIWLDAHVWEHERRAHQVELDHPGLFVATGLVEVPQILGTRALR